MTKYISTLVYIVYCVPNIPIFLYSELSNVILYNLATPYPMARLVLAPLELSQPTRLCLFVVVVLLWL